jgi:exodeoxyribonuclease VII small subunit
MIDDTNGMTATKSGSNSEKHDAATEELEKLSFEELLAKLDSIVKSLENGNLPLDRAVEYFEMGSKLQARCAKKLAEAKTRIEKVLAKPDSVTLEETSF